MDFFDLREQNGNDVDEQIKNYFSQKGYDVVYREHENGVAILSEHKEIFFIKKLTIERGEYFMGSNGFSWEISIKDDRKRKLIIRIGSHSKNEDNIFVYKIGFNLCKNVIKEEYDNFEEILNLIIK